jgi:hypothetical protein
MQLGATSRFFVLFEIGDSILAYLRVGRYEEFSHATAA